MNTEQDLASSIGRTAHHWIDWPGKVTGMDAHNRKRKAQDDAKFIWPVVALRFAMLMLFLPASLVWSSGVMATTSINTQFTAATIDPGNISKFRITIANTSVVALTAAAVTDNLPAQITISNPANIVNTCGFSSVSATPGSSQIKLTGGSIPAASGVDGQCYFEVDVSATVAGNWINTMPANGPTNGFIPGGTVSGYQATENTVTVTNTTPASATLSVRGLAPPTGTKSFSPATIYAGETSTLTIVLTNPSSNNTTLPLTTFTDNLPVGMKVAPTPAATVSCTGTGASNGTFNPAANDTVLTMTGGVIGGSTGVGGTCTLTVNVVGTTTTSTATLTNAVAAGAIGNTRGLSNLAFNGALTVNSPITTAKSFSLSPVGQNQDSLLTIDISNASTAVPLTISSVTDTLPTTPFAMTVGNVTATPPTIDCVTSGGGTNGTFSPALTQGATAITMVNAVVGNTGGTRRCRGLHHHLQSPSTAKHTGNGKLRQRAGGQYGGLQHRHARSLQYEWSYREHRDGHHRCNAR